MSTENLLRKVSLVVLLCLCSCGAVPPLGEVPDTRFGKGRAVVFDIDGTLTPSVNAINTVRPDAAEVANILAARGYQIIYLSNRMTLLSAGIPGWLRKNDFPEGSLQVVQTGKDRRDPVAFKTGILRKFVDRGWTVEYAYGDSSTDFEAYAAVGIPTEHVFALRREGENSCQPGEWKACLTGWTEHLDFVRQTVPRVPAN